MFLGLRIKATRFRRIKKENKYLLNMNTVFWVIFLCNLSLHNFVQVGPDPWDYKGYEDYATEKVPPDIKPALIKKQACTESSSCVSDWFFKRLLTFFVKESKVKQGENAVEFTVHLKFTEQQLETINKILKAEEPLKEEMYRKAVGYVEDAIYKPNLFQAIVLSWSEYVLIYLEQYKLYITWVSAFLAALLSTIWMWKRISQRHIVILIFVILYFYEAFISYKEAEQQDYEKFISTLNSCKLMFWSSTCDVPPPNPLNFIKHMHPLKIAMRLFSILVSEPLLTITDVVKTMIDGVCDGLFYPFDKIVHIVLILIINLSILMAALLIVCNYLLNIPFNLSFFAGLMNIGVRQRRRFIDQDSNATPTLEHGDRISGRNLDKLLTVFSQSIQGVSQQNCATNGILTSKVTTNPNSIIKRPGLRKSASAGRLDDPHLMPSLDQRTHNYNGKPRFEIGSGDYT